MGVTPGNGRGLPVDLFDLFQKKELARHILLKPFPLIDLTVMPDTEIMRHQHAAVMELIQKYIFQRDIMPAINQLAKRELWQLIEQIDGGHYLQKVIKYILEKGEMASPEKMLETIIQAIPDQEDNIMTGAQQLQQRAVEKKMFEVAKNMFTEGLDEQLVARTTGLPKAVLAKIKKEVN